MVSHRNCYACFRLIQFEAFMAGKIKHLEVLARSKRICYLSISKCLVRISRENVTFLFFLSNLYRFSKFCLLETPIYEKRKIILDCRFVLI